MTARRLWCWAAAGWSLLFAAPHFYWAVGGRAGLGSQVAAANAALERPWFAAYNVAAGCLGILGTVVALALLHRMGSGRMRRCAVAAAALAAVMLGFRGLVGVTLLAMDFQSSVLNGQVPALLLVIEPWFVLGGIVFGLMARAQYADESRFDKRRDVVR